MKSDAPKIGLLLGLGPKGKGAEEESGGEAKEAAAKAVLKAIASKDASALSEALQAHYDCCSDMGGDDEGED